MLGAEVHSSPMVADLDGDGTEEIVILTKDGKLHVLTPDGDEHSAAWPMQLGPASTIADGQNWVSGSAALLDLVGDPGLEILQATFDGKLHLVDILGNEAPGFPISMGSYSVDTPTVADLDWNGSLEIICRYDPNSVGVWSTSGAILPGWPRSIANAPGGAIDVWSSAAVCDLDADADFEIVMGGYDGFAHAFHHTGASVAGWPVDLNPSGGFPGWVLSSPASADFDHDGHDEVVIGSDDNRLWVLRGDGSSYLPGVWPQILPFGFRSSPALGDLDNDGQLDIVIGHRTDAGDLRLRALWHTGPAVAGWPIVQRAGFGGYTFGWLSALVADLGGDEIPEVIAVKERGVPDPDRAEIYAFSPHAIPVPGFPLLLEGLAYAMPTVCDLDGDGLAELLIGDLTHRLYRFDIDFAFNPEREGVEWHRFQRDQAHTGLWPGPFVNAILVDGSAAPPAGDIIAAPNPFRDQIELRRTGRPPTAAGDWLVYDLRGRLVSRLSRRNDDVVSWTGERDDGGTAAPGFYLVRSPGRGAVRVLRLR
jgi:hypothetical protein